MSNELCKYARKSHTNRRPVGAVMAVKIGDEVYIGWSRCHKKDLGQGKFNRTTARNMARGRATAMAENCIRDLKTPDHQVCPHSLRKEVKDVAIRAKNYFKAPVHECDIRPPQTQREAVTKKIIAIMAEQMGIDKSEVTPESRATDFKSLNTAKLMETIEFAFDLNVSEAQTTTRTVGQLIEWVCVLLTKKQSG